MCDTNTNLQPCARCEKRQERWLNFWSVVWVVVGLSVPFVAGIAVGVANRAPKEVIDRMETYKALYEAHRAIETSQEIISNTQKKLNLP